MGKSKKRDREKRDVLSLENGATAPTEPDPEEPRKIARFAAESAAAAPRSSGVNLIEAGGKKCTHEVAWPHQPESTDPAVPSGATV